MQSFQKLLQLFWNRSNFKSQGIIDCRYSHPFWWHLFLLTFLFADISLTLCCHFSAKSPMSTIAKLIRSKVWNQIIKSQPCVRLVGILQQDIWRNKIEWFCCLLESFWALGSSSAIATVPPTSLFKSGLAMSVETSFVQWSNLRLDL